MTRTDFKFLAYSTFLMLALFLLVGIFASWWILFKALLVTLILVVLAFALYALFHFVVNNLLDKIYDKLFK